MKQILSLTTLVFFTFTLFGQNFTITNGKKEKVISEKNVLEINLKIEGGDCLECSKIYLLGKLAATTPDSLSLDLQRF